MAKLTRRGFFRQTSVSLATLGMLARQTSVSLATLGMLAAVPSLEAVTEASDVPAAELPTATLAEPVVAHVSDLATGEVSVMVGTREIIYRDPEFVMRLLKAVR